MSTSGQPIVSVVMPVYQHEKFVEEGVASILSQTLSDIELIVVDDASTDSTLAKLERFDDPRLVVLKRGRNAGPSVALNDGLARATGRYVALLGGDDVAETWRLHHQVGIAEKRAADAVFSEPTIIDEQGRFLQRQIAPYFFPIPKLDTPAAVLRYLIVRGNFLCAPTALLRREAMLRLGGFDPELWQLQDYDYWLRMAAARMTFCLMERPVTRYRRHTDNLSNPSRRHQFTGEFIVCLHRILAGTPGDLLAETFPELIPPGQSAARPIDRAMIALSHGRANEMGAALLVSSFLDEAHCPKWPGLPLERVGELAEGNDLRSEDARPNRIIDPDLKSSSNWEESDYQGRIQY